MAAALLAISTDDLPPPPPDGPVGVSRRYTFDRASAADLPGVFGRFVRIAYTMAPADVVGDGHGYYRAMTCDGEVDAGVFHRDTAEPGRTRRRGGVAFQAMTASHDRVLSIHLNRVCYGIVCDVTGRREGQPVPLTLPRGLWQVPHGKVVMFDEETLVHGRRYAGAVADPAARKVFWTCTLYRPGDERDPSDPTAHAVPLC